MKILFSHALTLIAFMAVTLDRVTSISIDITMNLKMRSVSYVVLLTVVKKPPYSAITEGLQFYEYNNRCAPGHNAC